MQPEIFIIIFSDNKPASCDLLSGVPTLLSNFQFQSKLGHHTDSVCLGKTMTAVWAKSFQSRTGQTQSMSRNRRRSERIGPEITPSKHMGASRDMAKPPVPSQFTRLNPANQLSFLRNV